MILQIVGTWRLHGLLQLHIAHHSALLRNILLGNDLLLTSNREPSLDILDCVEQAYDSRCHQIVCQSPRFGPFKNQQFIFISNWTFESMLQVNIDPPTC